jgi:hypothetical protein
VTSDIADVEERLYGADLDEFVQQRTAAAKDLRGRGERGAAAAVAKLPKPSVAAWVVNRLARDEAKAVAELLDAGARLRSVQLGAGSSSDLRTAAEAQEAALRSLMRSAERIADGRGSAAPATLDRVRETLHAAALDAELAEQVRRGVLVREQRAVGFPTLAIPAERRRPAPKPGAKPARRKAAPAKPRDEVGEKRRERAAAAAQKAGEALAGAEIALAAAHEDLAEAEARAKEARGVAERAGKAHARAAKDAEQALERLRELGG